MHADAIVRITGFGCLSKNLLETHFGVLHEESASIFALPKDLGTTLGKLFRNPRYNCNLRRDSGGATYLYGDSAKQSRTLIGVNAGYQKPLNGETQLVSLMSPTASSAFVSWAKTWQTPT